MIASPLVGAARLSKREQRVIAAQVHVSAALILAALLFWRAGEQLDAIGRWELQIVMAVASVSALIGALLAWLAPNLSPSKQRAMIWQPLLLVAIPAVATVTLVGFAAAGACQLLVIAGVFAEIGARRRMLTFLWLVATITFTVSLWHLRTPWL